jgi:hypothetical protein
MQSKQCFNVYPNITIIKKIVKASYIVEEYLPFKQATLKVIFFDDSDNIIETKRFIIDETNGFNEWAEDDKYLSQFIKKQIENLRFINDGKNNFNEWTQEDKKLTESIKKQIEQIEQINSDELRSTNVSLEFPRYPTASLPDIFTNNKNI